MLFRSVATMNEQDSVGKTAAVEEQVPESKPESESQHENEEAVEQSDPPQSIPESPKPASPISPASKLKVQDSVGINDIDDGGDDDDVSSGCCCFGRRRKRRPVPKRDPSDTSLASATKTSEKQAKSGKVAIKAKKKGKKGENYLDPPPIRRRTVSVAALTVPESLVELNETDMDEVQEAHDYVDGVFSMNELNGLYADYKLNGKEITMTDFHIVFSTLSRSSDAAMGDIVFGMFDSTGSGKLSFKAFAKALAVMGRGTPDEKMEFCFNMIDKNNDGSLDHSELVGLLKYLPMKRLKRQNDALNRMSVMTEPEQLGEIREVDEEGKEEEDFDDSYRPRFGSTRGSGEASTIVRKRAHDSENEKIAIAVVDQAFEALQKPVTESLALEEFKSLSGLPEIAEYFMPFVFDG